MELHYIRRLTSFLLILCIVFALGITSFATNKTPAGHVTMSVEKFILGQGYIKEPMKVPFYEGENYAAVSARFFGEGNYRNTGSIQSGMYVSYIKDNLNSRQAIDINVPQYVLDAMAKYDGSKLEDLIEWGREDNWLGEFDFSNFSGWMYCQNGNFNGYGVSEAIPRDGDVLRWQFTLFGYGTDIGAELMAGDFGGDLLVRPANKDALTALVAEINSAENKAELLGRQGAQSAYTQAYDKLKNLESSQIEVNTAYDALRKAVSSEHSSDPDPKPEIPDGMVGLSAPKTIRGTKGTEFNVAVELSSWAGDDMKLFDSVISLPTNVEVVEVTPSAALSGGNLNYHLDSNGKLRLAYMSEELDSIAFTDSTFPATLLTVKAKLAVDIPQDLQLPISVDSLSFKADTSKPAVDFDTSSAKTTIGTISNTEEVKVSTRLLYQGDGTDLIPTDKKAVAVEFVNLSGEINILYGDQQLYFSPEISDQKGIVTYVAIVDSGTSLENMNVVDGYTFDSSSAKTILFADTDNNKVINAQDALNILSSWLRKTNAPHDEEILVMNVTADACIDTFDALLVMESYVNGSKFVVINK